MVMMNNWNSISEIKKFLEVPPSTSISDVRDILKQRLLDLHPDRTSGNFISADHEEKFHKVGSALDFIRHINSTELVRNESPSLEARTDQPIALRNAHSHPPSNIEIQNLATTIRA